MKLETQALKAEMSILRADFKIWVDRLQDSRLGVGMTLDPRVLREAPQAIKAAKENPELTTNMCLEVAAHYIILLTLKGTQFNAFVQNTLFRALSDIDREDLSDVLMMPQRYWDAGSKQSVEVNRKIEEVLQELPSLHAMLKEEVARRGSAISLTE